MEYIFVKEITDQEISETERKLDFTFPEDFRSEIKEFNDGRPKLDKLFLVNGVERVFEAFMSLNGGVTNILKCNVNEEFTNYIFFADDPFGNNLAFDRKNKEIYFYNHETNEFEKVASTWTELKNSLYEYVEE